MEQQQWRRRAGRRAAAATSFSSIDHGDARAESHADFQHRDARAPPVNPSHTITSASKVVRKSTTRATDTYAKPRSAPLPPSRWKELRQSVRIKATVETGSRRPTDAKIADLCDEDREKVAKLIHRIVEIGTLQEEAEAEFARQRSVLEAEITELRAQVKRDASELEDLSDTLKATLLKLRDYQERVLVLEESNEAEVCSRLESEQTMDLLKLEVEKLRMLVRTHTSEMEQRDRDEQSQFKRELEHLQAQLRAAQDELLQERRERILEKQRELDERLQRSMTTAAQTSGDVAMAGSAVIDGASVPATETVRAPLESAQHLDMSSFLNTSTELPDRIKRIMDEWKQRMEDAIAGSVQSISDQTIASAAAESARGRPQPSTPAHEADENACDARSGGEESEPSARASAVERSRSQPRQQRPSVRLAVAPSVTRVPFDRYLSIPTESEQESESEQAVDRRETHDATTYDRTKRTASGRGREHRRRDKSSARRRSSERHPRRSQPLRDGASDAMKYDSEDRDWRFRVERSSRMAQRRHVEDTESYSDDEVYDDGFDVEHEDGADELEPSDDDAGSASQNSDHPPIVLLNELEGGRRPGTSASFSSLYESSLFDVVDAIEDAAAGALRSSPAHAHPEHSRPASALRASEQCGQGLDQARRHENEAHLDTRAPGASPASARLTALLQGIQARERKLARLAQHAAQQSHPHSSLRDAACGPADTAACVGDVDADLALFDQVKDEYATELFTSRAQHEQRSRDSADWRMRDSEFEPERSLGPALSPQDLSVRDAIEQDMAELLRRDSTVLHTPL